MTSQFGARRPRGGSLKGLASSFPSVRRIGAKRNANGNHRCWHHGANLRAAPGRRRSRNRRLELPRAGHLVGDRREEYGHGATAGTKLEAADCELAVLATNWVSVSEALSGIDWRGRSLVDGTNAHKDAKPDLSADEVNRSVTALAGRTSSEIVADIAAGAKVVKAISHMPMAWIQDFSPQKPRSVMFASGDHSDAKRAVLELFESVGFCAMRLSGPLANGWLQQVGGPLFPASTCTSFAEFIEASRRNSALAGGGRCDRTARLFERCRLRRPKAAAWLTNF